VRYTWIAIVALGVIGCASPQRIERDAAAHEARAAQLEGEGDYYHADKERAVAQKQRDKAAERAYLGPPVIAAPILR
jgi:hypothetical protein